MKRWGEPAEDRQQGENNPIDGEVDKSGSTRSEVIIQNSSGNGNNQSEAREARNMGERINENLEGRDEMCARVKDVNVGVTQ